MTTITPTTRSVPLTRRDAERTATLAGRADLLALFLRDRGLRALAVAAENLAASIRATGIDPGGGLCPICRHRHPLATECCTLCGWRTVPGYQR